MEFASTYVSGVELMKSILENLKNSTYKDEVLEKIKAAKK